MNSRVADLAPDEQGKRKSVQDIANILASGRRLTSADLIGVPPADIEAAGRLLRQQPKVPPPADVTPKVTGAGIIMQERVGVDLHPGSDEADASDARAVNAQAVQREKARVETQGSWFDRVGAAIDKNRVVYLLACLGVGLLGLMLLRRPVQQIRTGQHLTRLTNIYEEIERTRHTMPIGAGGGIDSLPMARQRQAEAEFQQGVEYLKSYPRHEITRELVKNARLAENMGKPIRVVAIGRLIETLVQAGVALDMDDFAKSYT